MLRRLLDLFRKDSSPPFEMPPEEAFERTESGLGILHLDRGQGLSPGPKDQVTVRYAGWLPNGKRFDSSFPNTTSFPLSRVIPGWTEGLQLLSEGGSAKLLVPPGLGYGARGMPPVIPPGATLLFLVELVSVG